MILQGFENPRWLGMGISSINRMILYIYYYYVNVLLQYLFLVCWGNLLGSGKKIPNILLLATYAARSPVSLLVSLADAWVTTSCWSYVKVKPCWATWRLPQGLDGLVKTPQWVGWVGTNPWRNGLVESIYKIFNITWHTQMLNVWSNLPTFG